MRIAMEKYIQKLIINWIGVKRAPPLLLQAEFLCPQHLGEFVPYNMTLLATAAFELQGLGGRQYRCIS